MPEERRQNWVTKEDFQRIEQKIDCAVTKEDLQEVKDSLKTLTLLITGNGNPEKGFSTRLIGVESYLEDLGFNSSQPKIEKRVTALEIGVTRLKEYIENIQNRFVIPSIMFVLFGGLGFLWSLWVGKISFSFH